MAIFGLHYIKVSWFFMPIGHAKIFHKFNKQIAIHVIENYWLASTSKLSLTNCFFAIFLVRSWFLRSMGAVAQNWLIPKNVIKTEIVESKK